MSRLDQLQEIIIGWERPLDPLWKPPIEGTVGEVDHGPSLAGPPKSREYELVLTLMARFHCQDQHHDEARRVATRSLARALYSDVLQELDKIAHAVIDGDGRTAMHLINKLREVLTK